MMPTPGPWFAAELHDGDTVQNAVIGPDSVDPDGLHWETVVCRCDSWADAELIAGLRDQNERLTRDIGRLKGMTLAQAHAVHTPPIVPQAADVGACGANGVDQVVAPLDVEPGGERAMWDGGGGWL